MSEKPETNEAGRTCGLAVAPCSALMLDELSQVKFRVLQLESELAKAKRAQVSAEVNAKLATIRVENRVREALEGGPTSELWGPAGLIAATMRCVHAMQDSDFLPNGHGQPRPPEQL